MKNVPSIIKTEKTKTALYPVVIDLLLFTFDNLIQKCFIAGTKLKGLFDFYRCQMVIFYFCSLSIELKLIQFSKEQRAFGKILTVPILV
jgi:hypothetical protein